MKSEKKKDEKLDEGDKYVYVNKLLCFLCSVSGQNIKICDTFRIKTAINLYPLERHIAV